MTEGVGFSTQDKELDRLSQFHFQAPVIQKSEFRNRINNACILMKTFGVDATYIHAGSNLYYFTGMSWSPSERMVGAILSQSGELHFIAPKFEEGTILELMLVEGTVHCWEEHESPYKLFLDVLQTEIQSVTCISIDETTPFFITNGIQLLHNDFKIIDASPITAGCRMQKSEAELAIIQTAMDMTLEVQKSIGAILHEGITAKEICAFSNRAHTVCGATDGSFFCIALFGRDSAFPHGVRQPKPLEKNDVVLIDTGCRLHGYLSDITRTYVFGEATQEVRLIWNCEQQLQIIAKEAATTGTTCDAIDLAVRQHLLQLGLGPEYTLPGTPHRTGHGIGLDIHERPYIVKYEKTALKKGMTFSIEPMICVPNAFGIRLEDHVYMDDSKGNWFTEPSRNLENPFNY